MSKYIDNLNNYYVNTYSRSNICFTSGKGSILVDENGKEYIDFGSGIAVNGLGICNEKVNEAVIKQFNKIPHTSNLYYNEPQGTLAETLIKRTGMKRVFLSDSGAEANECAIKIARKYSFDKYGDNRNVIVALNNSFHGRTVTTLSATGQDVFHTYFMPFTEGFRFAAAGDLDAMKSALTKDVCAVIMELVQGEGGVVALDKDYVKAVAELCDKHDILLIIDEVQTGNGRCGNLYAYMEYGISPDVVTTAKGIANGLPLGVTFVGDKAEYTLSAGTHGSTFGGNLCSCAAAVEVLKQLDEQLFKDVKAKHDYIIKELSGCKGVKSVTGMGLMLGIDCEDNKAVLKACREKGLIVLTAKNKIRLLPALNIPDELLKQGVEIIKEVLK